MTIPKLNPRSERNSSKFSGRPRADFRQNGSGDPRERSERRTNPLSAGRPESEGNSQHFPPQLNQPQQPGVSGRRQQVEQLLRQRGFSNKAMADRLGVSVDTIKNDVQAICDAAGVNTTREYFAQLLQRYTKE